MQGPTPSGVGVVCKVWKAFSPSSPPWREPAYIAESRLTRAELASAPRRQGLCQDVEVGGANSVAFSIWRAMSHTYTDVTCRRVVGQTERAACCKTLSWASLPLAPLAVKHELSSRQWSAKFDDDKSFGALEAAQKTTWGGDKVTNRGKTNTTSHLKNLPRSLTTWTILAGSGRFHSGLTHTHVQYVYINKPLKTLLGQERPFFSLLSSIH